MFTVLEPASSLTPAAPPVETGCAWWNLACKGGHEIASPSLSAITKSNASGAEMLLSQLIRIVDQSSTVPLSNPTDLHVHSASLAR